MEIREIKERLSILTVLAYYNLKADSHGRLCCPFHDDKTPSMQVYPDTNTFCCFSANCNAGTGDQIQFIELMEKCGKHEAIVKAKELIGPVSVTPKVEHLEITAVINEADRLEREAVLTKWFNYYQKGLPRAEKAVAYLKTRCLNHKIVDVAYNSGGLHQEGKNKHLTASLVKYGLLKERPAGGNSVWAKDCIVFPLKNKQGKIISLYGRSITNDGEQRHFYLKDRRGLYPHYPNPGARKLILTESVIDAASILQQPDIIHYYNVLALYGTNGLTDEHLQVIIYLKDLREIILMLNRDEAGEAATARHYSTLRELLPEMKISKVELPEGEDVNSVLQAHDNPKALSDLLERRKDFFVSIETPAAGELKTPAAAIITAPALQPAYKLITTNPELLIYDSKELYIEVLSGIKVTGLDRMKVTLKVRCIDKMSLPVWHSLDLYNHGQREQAVNSIAEAFETGMQSTTATIAELTSSLESYRLQRMEALQARQEPQAEMTAAQRQAAISELKKPELLKRTSQLIAMSGIVGEEHNALVAYLAYSTRKQPVPLHVMLLGSSGSGKTYLQERISELIPPEDRIEITQVTENAFYYFKQHELKHKLILIEDLDGAMAVFYPLRELQTKRRISKTVTLKDSKGNLKTITLTVEGPVSVSGCTTRERLYEDNANRCILLYIDQSKEQDKRITGYQVKLSAGEINKQREHQYRELFCNMQRLLRPVAIINPYAKWIQLPDQVFKPRQTMTLLLGFIEAITLYHQFQREVKKDAAGQLYIETTVGDIEAAFMLLKDVLFSKSDELSKATRGFLEQVKVMLQQSGTESFTARDMRKELRLAPTTIKRYLFELERYGYIKRNGNRYVKYEYSITDQQEYARLKSSIDEHLQNILVAIRESIAGSPVAQ
ncbi:MAG: toprim domain-containing protein [Williamsia sp.]|nr:toprim domain-containing protein [Williamsia sp.]